MLKKRFFGICGNQTLVYQFQNILSFKNNTKFSGNSSGSGNNLNNILFFSDNALHNYPVLGLK